jgi:hypothetical protein
MRVRRTQLGKRILMVKLVQKRKADREESIGKNVGWAKEEKKHFSGIST